MKTHSLPKIRVRVTASHSPRLVGHETRQSQPQRPRPLTQAPSGGTVRHDRASHIMAGDLRGPPGDGDSGRKGCPVSAVDPSLRNEEAQSVKHCRSGG